MAKPGSADVVIFEREGRYHVHPPTLYCSGSSDVITFRNLTRRKARVWLPALGLQSEEFGPKGRLKLPAKGVSPGVYEYSVSVEATKPGSDASRFAEGNSAPRMIFD